MGTKPVPESNCQPKIPRNQLPQKPFIVQKSIIIPNSNFILPYLNIFLHIYAYLVTGSCARHWPFYQSTEDNKGAMGAITPIKCEKIEGCVIFTPNIIPKSLKTHHFLNETSKFKTQSPKNAFLRLKNTPGKIYIFFIHERGFDFQKPP